jgi:hypothetical protein
MPANQQPLGDMAYQSTKALVIKPQSAAAPASPGDMVFQLVSNTLLRIRVQGSDGVLRWADINLIDTVS